MSRLRFGIFLAPFHPAGENPTTAIQRDLELVAHLDRLDYDEAWIGEHHSAGSEIIASPEIFIAAAAERTKRIKLGTGVTSISYHNPLWVAERMVMLDHLTRGRVMLGCGPGSLPTDSMMLGLNPTDTR
jgi:limonene 1,2-monooxygenase